MHLHHLVYFSKLAQAPTPDWSAIEHQSRLRNADDGVTGFLILGGGYAFQVLEGRRSDISRTVMRIARDPRHAELTVALAGDIEQRHFPKSPMTLVDLQNLRPGLLQDYYTAGRLQPLQMTGTLIWDMIVRTAEETDPAIAD